MRVHSSRPEVPEPLFASDVLLGEDEIARRARTALASADHGLLALVSDAGRFRWHEQVSLYDDDGEPVLIIARDGPAARTARAGRLVSLALNAPSPHGVRVRLTGRLRPCADHRTPGNRHGDDPNPLRPTPAIAADQQPARLLVDQVYAGCPRSGPWDRGAERRIPLETYALTVPDYLAAHLPRVTRYVNTHHAEQVRRLAAATASRPLDHLAAAHVTDLGTTGAVLHYVDAEGGHETALRFAAPLDTVPQIATALAQHLRAV